MVVTKIFNVTFVQSVHCKGLGFSFAFFGFVLWPILAWTGLKTRLESTVSVAMKSKVQESWIVFGCLLLATGNNNDFISIALFLVKYAQLR